MGTALERDSLCPSPALGPGSRRFCRDVKGIRSTHSKRQMIHFFFARRLCVCKQHGSPSSNGGTSERSWDRLRDRFHCIFRSNCPAPRFHTGYESQWAVCGGGGCVHLYTRKFLSDMLLGHQARGLERVAVTLYCDTLLGLGLGWFDRPEQNGG